MKKIEVIVSIIICLAVIPLFLFWMGYAHVAPLFEGEFTQHLGSIEVSYITMAKYISTGWPKFLWQPLWYMGYPMSMLYTPFVPFFEFVANAVVGWSYSHAYRVLTGFAYAGGLVTLYFFARSLFKNTVAGIITALSYGLLPSIIALFYSEVAQDVFSMHFIDPRRFTILIRWGEGPHTVSLFFLPLAAMGYLKFLRQGNKWWLVWGGIFSAFTIMTNSLGAWALAILGFCILIGTWGEMAHETKSNSFMSVLFRTVLFGIVSYGLAAFWYNPLFLSNFFREGSTAGAYWRDQFPWGWLIIIGFLVVYFFLTKKILYRIHGASSALLFLGMMFYFVNTYYASGLEKLELVPQVLRLNTEVDMGVSLFFGLLVTVVVSLFQRKKRLYWGMSVVVLIVCVVLALPRQNAIVGELPVFTKSLESTGKSLEQSAEYEVAKSVEAKVTGQERVVVPGNYSFYLNYFGDVPQLRGALFQSAIHPWSEHIYYQLTNGREADISLDWLKIANVGWLVYGGPREMYRDFKVPATKFDEVLTLDEEKNADRYYKVPLKNSSLAKAVPKEISEVPVPKNAIDREPITSYVSLLEASDHKLTMTEKANGHYKITGELGEGEAVLVQMAYAAGWDAKMDDGGNVRISKDPLGFIFISPEKIGTISLDLVYTLPWQVRIGQIGTFVIIMGIGYLLIKGKKNLFVIHAPKKESATTEGDSEE